MRTGEQSIEIAAPPERVWALVSDVTRMGEWSPETYRCEWLDGATGPAVGARFKGRNKHGILRWSTTPRVVACEPGKEFAFNAELFGRPMTRWTYRCEPTASGTRLVESYQVLRDGLFARLEFATGRAAQLERGMAATLARIKAAAEHA